MREERYAQLYEAFSLLGEDTEVMDVEFAAEAQWEVIQRGGA